MTQPGNYPPPPLTPPQQGWARSEAESTAANKLIQIEAHLNSIRNMMVFFVVFTLLFGGVGVWGVIATNGN